MKLVCISSLVSLFIAVSAQSEAQVVDVPVAVDAEGLAAEAAVVEEEPAFLVENVGKGRQPCVRRYASSSSSSSSDSCDCCEECNKVYFDWMDFYTTVPNFDPITGTWAYYEILDQASTVVYTANNSQADALITGCSGGILNTKVYNTYQPGLGAWTNWDHAKWWGYAKTPIPIPPHGDVVVKFEANVQTYATEENPFPSAIVERNDYRLASGRFTAFDPETGLNFAFVVTNNRVYVYYELDPALVAPAVLKAGTTGFAFIIPVKIRRVCDWHSLELVFYGDSKEVGYFVDGQEVFVINKPGYRLDRSYMVEDYGGAELALWPTQIFYGFGSFTSVDYYPACQRSESCSACRYPFIREGLTQLDDNSQYTAYNPIFGPTTPAVFYAVSGADGTDKIWGQGSVTKIRKLVAYQRVPVCKK